MKVYTEDQIRKAFIDGMEFIPVHPLKYEQDADEYISELSPIELPSNESLKDKLFHLANEFAVAGYGKTAVILHTIHNGFDINEQGGNK